MKPLHLIVVLGIGSLLVLSVIFSLSTDTEADVPTTLSLDVIGPNEEIRLPHETMTHKDANTASEGGGSEVDEDRGLQTGIGFDSNSRGLAIRHQDSSLLYDYPGIMLLVTHDFTFELWYRTPHQPMVTIPVAIFSNYRDSISPAKYGRQFWVMLQPSGKVLVEYHAMDTVKANGDTGWKD